MTTFLEKMPAWLGGGGAAGDHERPWRKVPRLSVVDGARGPAITPLVLLLAFAALAGLFALQYTARDYIRAGEDAERAGARIESTQAVISREETLMAGQDEKLSEAAGQLAAMQEQSVQGDTSQGEAAQAYEGLIARIDWAIAFEILLGVDGDMISFRNVSAEPDGKIEASGVAIGGLNALRELQAYLGEVDDVLDLLSLQSEDEEGIRTFSVEIAVR